MHFERFKVHSRAQSASTNRTGFGVFLWCSSCLGQSTGEMPARHLSLSLSLSFSFPPSLSFSLSLSLSIPGITVSGTSYVTVVQARHDRFLLMPSRPVGRTRTRRVSGSPSQVLSHKHSTCLISRCDQNVRERKILDGASERLRETHSMRDPLHFYEHISRNREATCAVQVAPSTAPCWGDSYPKWQMSRQRHSKAQQR